ncbi:Glycosyltransferase involved in cell wall bisynthesis [Reichenbachiella agariperforans]|uniref:Glycosyltransferase involved in cell wall bisynthesis n=1 Tax=Reichenbachiella agariperforans TaxID=156994 RepID=A0A1M6T2G3_REIAG|nr:glycosyltransferase family 4 protein [Reichenbachiella agariperforans]SHK51117.1 Glycosyltransferase involved in cell wall bisynthesis [Reichenbachiella agariperforans]
MRIGMILDTDFPPDPRVENEAVTLIEAGFEVYLFCLDYKGCAQPAEEIKGIQVRRFYCGSWVYKLSAWAYTFPFYHWILKRWIAAFLSDNPVDAIHIHDIQIARSVFNLKLDIPVVLDLHENRPEIMKFYGHLQKFPGKQTIFPSEWEKYESKYIQMADRTVVVTEEAKEYYLKKLGLSPDQLIVVPNTVRAVFEKEAKHDATIVDRLANKFVILYVGDTGLRRGLLTAIEAMPELSKHIPDVKLVIVGSNKTDGVLKAKVEELRVHDYVDFEGWQDFTLFQSYITVSDVCISPLHRNVHHDTTYANKIFQYMAFAKPLIVSDCLAQETVIRRANSGLVHQAESVEDYQQQVLKLYEDTDLRQELGENGKAFVSQDYNWERTSHELINYYNQIETDVI